MTVRGAQIGIVLLCLAGCNEAPVPRQRKILASATETPRAQDAPAVKKPRRVFDLKSSAYGARLDFDGDTLVLATRTGLHVAPAVGPASSILAEFGDSFALWHSRVVYFREGQLLESVGGAPPKVLGKVPGAPRLIALDGAHVAWVDAGAEGSFRIATFQGTKARTLLALAGPVDTMVLLGSWVFFFEQGRGGTWRLGGVSLDGGKPVYRPWQTGRVPATLAALDDLYYYEGPSRSVRRVSPDLSREEVLSTGVICSPLAVSDRVICGQVGGLFELPLTGGPPEKLAVQASLVAGLATSSSQVAWISDAGEDRLIVKAQQLPPSR